MQTKGESLYEALVNLAWGYSFGVLSNWLVLPLFGVPVSVGQSLGISAAFSFISLVRSYAVRRWFNAKEKKVCP